MQSWIILSLVLGISGCATTNATHTTGSATFLKHSGLAIEMKPGWSGYKLVEAKNTFDPEDKQILWWAEFEPLAFLTQQKFLARWYAPDGTLFSMTEGGTFLMNSIYATAALSLQNTQAAQQPGEWKVEIFWKEHQIDTRTFRISSGKSSEEE